MSHFNWAPFLWALFIAVFVVGCTDAPEPAELVDAPAAPNPDALPGGLFHDFFEDGKFDAAGHPNGAQVFEGEVGCSPTTGAIGDQGVAAEMGRHEAGVLCQGTPRALGAGTFALNVRALMDSVASKAAPTDTVLTITVFDAGAPVASREVTVTDLGDDASERDLAVNFVHRGDSEVTFSVEWAGGVSARVTYVEVFRSTPRLVISPASQSLMPGERPTFEIEMQDPPDGVSFDVSCDGVDRTESLTELLGSGDAQWVDTEFRTIVSVPGSLLLEGCTMPSRVTVSSVVNGWPTETSRVTYLDEPIPCAYSSDDPASVRVLLSGFEPFPADSDRDNSSKEAVDAYVAGPIPDGVAVMRAVLPVEYDAAPMLLEDLIIRCEPDIIVGFGQGRWAVDVETTAYNRKDSAAVAGGVPDNRGVVYGGDPIQQDGPPERTTGLPVEPILGELAGLGISAGPSNDPGRYVCNNLFYTIMRAIEGDGSRSGGFVHLPRIPTVGAAERETLRQTVTAVVDATLRDRLAAK